MKLNSIKLQSQFKRFSSRSRKFQNVPSIKVTVPNNLNAFFRATKCHLKMTIFSPFRNFRNFFFRPCNISFSFRGSCQLANLVGLSKRRTGRLPSKESRYLVAVCILAHLNDYRGMMWKGKKLTQNCKIISTLTTNGPRLPLPPPLAAAPRDRLKFIGCFRVRTFAFRPLALKVIKPTQLGAKLLVQSREYVSSNYLLHRKTQDYAKI